MSPSPAPDPAVQLLLDRGEVHDVLMRYAFALDRREFGALAACFAPDLGGTWGFGAIPDPAGLHDRIRRIPGVLDSGLFAGMADLVLIEGKDRPETVRLPAPK